MKYYNDQDESPALIGHKFTTKKDVDDYFSGDRIRCLICGKWLKAIGGQHLKSHGITVEKYKEMFGLPNGRGLVCGETSAKQQAALKKRIAAGDKTLTPLTPELMFKAQHAQKKRPPQYHINDISKYAVKGIRTLKKRARERTKSIDWDNFIKVMTETGKSLYSLSEISGMPTYYDLQMKIINDPEFERIYNKALKKTKLKHAMADEVYRLRADGLSTRGISRITNISTTHVKRILKQQHSKGDIDNWGDGPITPAPSLKQDEQSP